MAIIGFMPTHGNGAIGSLDYTADERKRLAKKYVPSLLYSSGVLLSVHSVDYISYGIIGHKIISVLSVDPSRIF